MVGHAVVAVTRETCPGERRAPVESTSWQGPDAACRPAEVSDPPLELRAHPIARRLLDKRSRRERCPYKYGEDLIDAPPGFMAGELWMKHGFERCRVLGAADVAIDRARVRETIAGVAAGSTRDRGSLRRLTTSRSGAPNLP